MRSTLRVRMYEGIVSTQTIAAFRVEWDSFAKQPMDSSQVHEQTRILPVPRTKHPYVNHPMVTLGYEDRAHGERREDTIVVSCDFDLSESTSMMGVEHDPR